MGIIWCDKDELKITSDVEPKSEVVKILPTDSKEVKQEKKDKPYRNKKRVLFTIDYLGNQYCILIKKDYRWDGASIPVGFRWLIGSKGDPQFLNPSMVHDVLCENHYLIGYDRQLSSIVFRELLIASGISKVKAYTMYYAVDTFQKLLCHWDKKDKLDINI